MKTTNNHMAVWIQVMIPALLFFMVSCEQYELSSASNKPLVGTVWKLEGFGSPDTSALIIPQPVNEYNYQLLLESGGNAYGESSANYMAGKYMCDEEKQTLGIDMQVLTEAMDTPDGQLYIERLSKIHRYEMQGDVLRLYHPEGYLQYRPAADDSYMREIASNLAWKTPPADMLWKLEGFGADNNTLTVAQPHNEESYLLYLQKNVNAFGTTSVNTFRAEYKVDTTLGTLTIGPLGTTKINEQQDGQRYVDCLSRVTRYQHNDATLRLYYSDTEYLQYRPATDDTSFREKITGLFGEIAWQ